MPFIRVNSPSDDIWEVNPSLELISEFIDFRKKEGKKKSGAILKAIYYVYDPNSDLRDSGMSEEKIKEEVTSSILSSYRTFDWDKYQDIVELYKKYNITKSGKLLIGYQEQIESLNRFLENWHWSKNDAKDKASVMKQYKELFADLAEVEANFKEEQRELELLAGYTKSRWEEYA